MKKMLFALLTLLLSSNVTFAETADGKTLHQEKCSTCHMLGGDHTVLYQVDRRKVKNYGRLKGQVSMCLQNLNIDWFPEEENSVVNYLNDQYYHFKNN
jgi:cytochrome c553